MPFRGKRRRVGKKVWLSACNSRTRRKLKVEKNGVKECSAFSREEAAEALMFLKNEGDAAMALLLLNDEDGNQKVQSAPSSPKMPSPWKCENDGVVDSGMWESVSSNLSPNMGSSTLLKLEMNNKVPSPAVQSTCLSNVKLSGVKCAESQTAPQSWMTASGPVHCSPLRSPWKVSPLAPPNHDRNEKHTSTPLSKCKRSILNTGGSEQGDGDECLAHMLPSCSSEERLFASPDRMNNNRTTPCRRRSLVCNDSSASGVAATSFIVDGSDCIPTGNNARSPKKRIIPIDFLESTNGSPPVLDNPSASSKEPWPVWSFKALRDLEPEVFRRLTGLRQPHFFVLYEFLGGDEVCQSLKYNYKRGTPKKFTSKLSCHDRLCMTLIRLRRGWDISDIALLFGVSTSVASDICYVFVQLMYFQFQRMKRAMFVTRHDQPRHRRPGPFKRFNNFRVVLDTTEIRTQIPSNYHQQGNTYSDYKAGNVILYLLGITCWGTLSFISQGFEGGMKDSDIFERSDILKYLEPKDLVMVDRGFRIRESTDVAQVYLLHPPFLKTKRSSMTREELIRTKSIAATRIYVEHGVRLLKTFNVLKKIRNNMLPLLDQIVYVCGCLSNFDPPHLNDAPSGEDNEE